MSDLSLRLIRNTNFSVLYEKLIVGSDLSYKQQLNLLAIAIIFINSDDLFVKQLGYRIIVVFSNRYESYEPLYEIAINQGLYPISHFIDTYLTKENRKNFFTEINESYSSLFKKGDIYQSLEQYRLNNFYTEKINNSVSVIAPTSYGKSDLIIDTIKLNLNKKICVITPTKSLLAQTRKRILSAKIDGLRKVVVHPEMFNPNDLSCVAVLTQERLLRLLKDSPYYSFDYIIIDEAHEILDSSNSNKRSELLASVIIILNKRNPNTVFKFLTPFIKESSNLKVRYATYDLAEYKINEYLKTEKIYVYDINGYSGLHLYDQFLDKWYDNSSVQKNISDVRFLLRYKGNKNIVYFNKPIDIESFAKKIIAVLPDVEMTNELSSAITHLSEYISPEYTLVKCLKKGFVYHHGAIPDNIRQYIENIYSSTKEVSFVLTTSTLLEGVNLPAEKMFLYDNRKGLGNLSPSNFKNLIGRVCRFSDVFSENNSSLKGLEPEIYIVVGDYFRKKSDYKSFVSNSMKVDKKIVDECSNVLLEKTSVTSDKSKQQLKQAKEFVENYENGSIENYQERRLATGIGKICISNNVSEFDVFKEEQHLQELIDSLKNQQKTISDTNQLIETFNQVFVNLLDEKKNENLIRFRNEATRNYYSMFINQRLSNDSYAQMVQKTVDYWNTLIHKNKDTVVFVGKWGDITRDQSHRKYWTDISKKNRAEKINLAIVRIKEEQDFIDNNIMKFVEVFHDVNLVDETFYKKLKYGTADPLQIVLVKNGFSLSLSKLLTEKYIGFVNIDKFSNIVIIDPTLIKVMQQNGENDILIFETQNNIF